MIQEHEHRQQVPWRRFLQETWNSKGGMGKRMPQETNVLGLVRAFVNHGRWLASCPMQGCNAAYIVSSADPMLFCAECGGGWWRVVFPLDKRAIEEQLLKRPGKSNPFADVETRNWIPGETVEDLVRENLSRGID